MGGADERNVIKVGISLYSKCDKTEKHKCKR